MRMLILISVLCACISLQALEITISTANNPAAIQVVTLAIDEGVIDAEITGIHVNSVDEKISITMRTKKTKQDAREKIELLYDKRMHCGDIETLGSLTEDIDNSLHEMRNLPSEVEVLEAVSIITTAMAIKSGGTEYVPVDASKKYEYRKRVAFLKKLRLLSIEDADKQLYRHHPAIPSSWFLSDNPTN